MPESRLAVIDFHTHYLGPNPTPAPTDHLPNALRAHWNAINAKLADESALLADIDNGDLVARVVNTPTALLADPDGAASPGSIARINDTLAALVQRHPNHFANIYRNDILSAEWHCHTSNDLCVELIIWRICARLRQLACQLSAQDAGFVTARYF
jgi:hypothetical protein